MGYVLGAAYGLMSAKNRWEKMVRFQSDLGNIEIDGYRWSGPILESVSELRRLVSEELVRLAQDLVDAQENMRVASEREQIDSESK